MTSVRCAIYLRVSVDRADAGADDARLAVTRQFADCKKIADDRGWEIVETYEDNSISASKNVLRPAYEQMSVDYAAGKFSAIVVWDLDRLTRKPVQLEAWIEAAAKKGLHLVTANGDADLGTESGILFARIKAAVAASEVALKSKRQLAAALQRRNRGIVPSGVRLTGYDQTGAIVPAEAEVVSRMFDLFLRGESLSQIAKTIDQEGVPTRSGQQGWPSSSVRTILCNPRYAGLAVLNGKSLGHLGNWTPIVDEPTFTAVQNLLADPRRVTNRGGSTSRIHLGAGLYLCGTCGEAVRTNGPQYWCATKGHLARTRAYIDSYIRDLVVARLNRPDIAAILESSGDPGSPIAAAEVRRLRMRLEAIANDYDSGLIDGERFRVASEKVRATIQTIAAKAARTAADARTAELLTGASPAEAFVNADLNSQRGVINSLMIVTLLKGIRGRKGFDPDSVQIEWRASF
jgi:site-specific DNA recombinase